MDENEKMELMESVESTDLDFLEGSDLEGGNDMLVGAAIGAGATALLAGGIWLWRKLKAKRAAKKAELEEDFEDDAEEADSPEEPVKEESKKDEKKK